MNLETRILKVSILITFKHYFIQQLSKLENIYSYYDDDLPHFRLHSDVGKREEKIVTMIFNNSLFYPLFCFYGNNIPPPRKKSHTESDIFFN